jgi:NADH-quinone oxidoreductase subunit G
MSTAPAKPADLVTVNIDGRAIAVPKGTNVIEAAKLLGIEIPHYCYHPKLSIVGNCRMCLIEMGMPAVDPATKQPVIDAATGQPKINWIPRPQIGCGTNASPGLHIRTNSPMVKDCREGVTEMLLINHPLDCPICDQAGECKLQEHSTAYGRGYSRFVEQKNVKPKRTQLGPRVTLDDERCILCSRCIRFSKEIAKDDVLGFIDRGSYSTLTCYPGKKLQNNYSLNTVDICPVGALTSTDFRFKMRVWFLKRTPGIDTESSVGVNTEVWSREGTVYRLTPRRNDAVNDTWMADSGRMLFKDLRVPERLPQLSIKGIETDIEVTLKAATRLLTSAPVAIVASGRSTVEEQFLTRKLAEAVKAKVYAVSRIGPGDGLLVSADRNPNIRGALVTGLIDTLPVSNDQEFPDWKTQAKGGAKPVVTGGLNALSKEINAGNIKVLLSVGEDLVTAGLTPAQLNKISVIYLGTHANATTEVAKMVIPTLTALEKNGTFINQQFRLQKFSAAVPGPRGAFDDLAMLSYIIAAVGGGTFPTDVHGLWPMIAAEVKALAGLSYATLPAEGHPLDASPWAALPFAEGETLHYKPATPPATVAATPAAKA